MRPIKDNPVLLGLGQMDDYSFLSLYVNGLTYSARIERTALGHWRGEVLCFGTDTTSLAIVHSHREVYHSHREVYVYEDRSRVASWLSDHFNNALRWPSLTMAEHRLIDHLNANLSLMTRCPGMWGGPEATELQMLQAMEFRDRVLHPNAPSRDILDQHAAFLRREFQKHYCNLPAYQIYQRMYPLDDAQDITARVTEMMGRFNQELLAADR